MGGAEKNGVPPSAPLFKAVAVRDCNGFFCFKSLSEESKPFGPECAKPCRCAGAFTLKIGRALCPEKHRQTILPPSAPLFKAVAVRLALVEWPLGYHPCDIGILTCGYMPGAVSQAGQGDTPPEPPNAQSARTAPRFDAASPSRHSGCRIRMLFMDTLAHPITNQRYSPHTHGKCTEKASFFIPTNRQCRKGCDKKEVIE